MAQFKNTFSQGLDKDSSKNKYDNTHYFDAENIRIVTQEGLSSGAIENVVGNYRRVYTGNASYYINGHVILRDYLILWTTDNTGAPNGISTDRIWRVPIADIDALSGVSLLTLSATYVYAGGNLLYSGHLSLSTLYKVRAVARYESSTIQKVYWIDGYNRLRHLNTIYNADTNDLVNLSLDKLEVISNFDVSRPEITSFSSGNLRSGKVQYTYQLYTLNGSETAFSPLSHLVNLTDSGENNASSDGYMGSDLDINTGKAVIGSIDITATGYNRIRILAVHYTTLQGDPQIRMIDEKDISPLGEEISFVDAGQNLAGYTLEQIRLLGTFLFVPQEISTKDNILFPANIKEESFDIDFDARAYRFAGAGTDSVNHPNYQATAGLRRHCRIYDAEGNYYEGDGADPTGSWTGSGLTTVTGWSNIPEDFDAINKFNDIDNDGDHAYRFMYQTDGVTIGGEGPNVKYTFKMKTIELDDYDTVASIKTGIETPTNPDNRSYNNYASPYQCARYLGYPRDEVYRFGIVFFEDKGRASFVKWIGDLRTPSISTAGTEDTYDPDGGVPDYQINSVAIIAFSLGNSCTYEIQIDNDPFKIAYGYSTNEASLDDPYDAITDAIANYLGWDVTLTNLDPVNRTFDIEFKSIGDHTITITSTDYSGFCTNVISTPYAGAGGEHQDFSPVFYNSVTGKIMMNILYPEFTVDLTGTEAEGMAYQIVRVKREANDRSVRAQGILTGLYDSTTHRYPMSWDEGGSSNWHTDLVCFNSPEVAFNKNLDRQYGDKLQVTGIATSALNDFSAILFRRKYNGITPLNNPQTPSGAVLGDEFYSLNLGSVDELAIATMDTAEAIVGGVTYHNEMQSNAGAALNSDKGINAVCDISTAGFIAANDLAATSRYLINYRRNVFLYQYGGPTYEARSRNIYMATGRVQTSDSAIIPVFDGDSYIGMFDYLHGGYKQDNAAGTCSVVIFPVETSINLDLRMDSCYHARQNETYVYLMRETKGIWSDDDDDREYIQPTDLYIYNTVYSKENTTKIYISRPFDWTVEKYFDTRILASGVKTNNELSDSWLNYGANSYIDVDPQYGELIALINLNNQMLFFQPKAFGTLSINQQALIQTNSIAQLSLGSSGVLSRFDYSKTEMGVSHRDHILLTSNGLYWVDFINKAMFKYTSGVEELSLMKGMQSWFREKLSGDIALSDIILYHDPQYKEVNVVIKSLNEVITSTIEYGALYNWYAATDAREIAADGWHVPTSAEFETLSDYLGGDSVAGGKLKETGTTYWDSPNTGATNEVNFNARGAGGRGDDGTFAGLMQGGAFITSTRYFEEYYKVSAFGIFYNSEADMVHFAATESGLSLRLIKDSTTLSDGETGTYTGNDGKIYRTICIGTQEWVADNIAETKYRDGSDIPIVTDNAAWAALVTGAMCYYNNDSSNGLTVVNESVENYNLVYNEITDAFICRYTFYPEYVINYNDKVLSSSDRINFYRHNDASATRCQFYGGTVSPSSITLIVNPSAGDMNIFTNLEWLTEVYNLVDNMVGETFTGLRISNDYQDTGDITLTNASNIKRRIRTWRHTIGRALFDENGVALTRSDARIRDSYIKLKLEFNNTNARKFIAHDIITSFIPSNK